MPSASAKKKAVPTVITVSRSVKLDGSDETTETQQEETIEVHEFATTPAMVEFRYPIKRSKDYQSAGIEIGVTLPCYVEEIPAAMERAKDLVVTRLQAEIPRLAAVLDKLCDLR